MDVPDAPCRTPMDESHTCRNITCPFFLLYFGFGFCTSTWILTDWRKIKGFSQPETYSYIAKFGRTHWWVVNLWFLRAPSGLLPLRSWAPAFLRAWAATTSVIVDVGIIISYVVIGYVIGRDGVLNFVFLRLVLSNKKKLAVVMKDVSE